MQTELTVAFWMLVLEVGGQSNLDGSNVTRTNSCSRRRCPIDIRKQIRGGYNSHSTYTLKEVFSKLLRHIMHHRLGHFGTASTGQTSAEV
jgi:hypothetical protein